MQPLALHAGRGLTLVRGEGMHLWDDQDRRHLDMMSNYGVNILGHAHPALTAAIREQAALLTNAHQSFDIPARTAAVAALGDLLPEGLSHVSFANSGAEAVEAAIKYAVLATGRARVVAAEGGYHGRTLGALAATAAAQHREPFLPLLAETTHVPWNDLDALAAALDDDVAAVILEPIQGEAGIRVADAGYLAGAAELCAANGSLLIADEVQTGLRTGAVLASSHDGVVPDIACLSKGIAGGIPAAVTVVTGAVAERIPRGAHGSTFAGNPLACAAMAATLRIAGGDGFQAHVREVGVFAQERLRSIGHPLIREVRGRGLMLAVELRRPAGPVLRALQDRGVLALPAGSNLIRLLPPLIAEAAHIEEAADALAAALDDVAVRPRQPLPVAAESR